ncbi:MAG: hypothetical protein WDZ59_02900 [Pirellulales bacterium]
MTAPATETLAEWIACKCKCLIELRDLGRRQMELIDRDEMTQLIKVLAAKQHLIARVQEIEQALDPFRHEAPEQRCWPSAEARQRCAEQSQHCQQLLGEIVMLERASEQRLAERRNAVATRLEQISTAEHVHTAYIAHEQHRSGTLDVTTEK